MVVLFIMLLVMLPILIPAIKRQLQKPEFTDAGMFVDFVSNDLFKDLDIVVAVKTPRTNLYEPDLRFFDPRTNFEFYVKCCYYADLKKTNIIWCTEQQFKNYQTLTTLPLFIIFGVGGSSHFPDKLYFIPFNRVGSNELNVSELEHYEVKYNHEIDFSIY